jgi:hypothetical protein
MNFRAIWIAYSALTACAAQPASAPTPDGFAPRMFDAAQLREAFPAGTELRFRFELEGKPTVFEHWTWVTSTSTIAVVESEHLDADGKRMAPPERSPATWQELADHGLFPADKTTIEDQELDSALGRRECRLYRVEATDAQGEPVTRTFYFAKDLPGPPIRFETWKNGRRIFRAEMIERKP